MPEHQDFVDLNKKLLMNADDFLYNLFPNGRKEGKEFFIGSLRGERGGSLKVCTLTGLWSDFNDGIGGKDLIDLYAKKTIKSATEAYNELTKKSMQQYIARPAYVEKGKIKSYSKENIKSSEFNFGIPPKDTLPPSVDLKKSWIYKTKDGNPIFYITRVDRGDRKDFYPHSWDFNSNSWICNHWKENRPLYGLEKLSDKPILIVEGEKSCEAARLFVSNVYDVVTWSGGANAIKNSDWSPLYGKNILLWPDADKAGFKAMEQIAGTLKFHCSEIKLINIKDKPEGWDAGDAADEGWNWPIFKEWLDPINPEKKEKVIEMQVESSSESSEIYEQYGIAIKKNGTPEINEENVLRILESVPLFKDCIWYDEFYDRIFSNLSGCTKEWNDYLSAELLIRFQREYIFKTLKLNTLETAVNVFAKRNIRNEPKDWMNSLNWDGTKRIQDFFFNAFETKVSQYSLAASENLWISMVARILRPGCKVDNMVILEGKQGSLKSTALEIIGGKWYTNTNQDPSNKDFYQCLQGKLLIEIAELSSFGKALNETIKNMLSTKVDRFRKSYGKVAEDYFRQNIFIGSTNDVEYLKDQTGGRRFWPIKINNINLDYIKQNREQLFAESVAKFKSNATWWEMPYEETKLEQENRLEQDDWIEVIERFLRQNPELILSGFRREHLLVEKCLNISMSNYTPMLQRRITKCLIFLGYKNEAKYQGVGIKTKRLWQITD